MTDRIDWVKAMADCGVERVFEELVSEVKKDIESAKANLGGNFSARAY